MIDVVTYMIPFAPWGALNALLRTCKTTASMRLYPIIARHVSTRWLTMQPAADCLVCELPNGLRHGESATYVSGKDDPTMTIEYHLGRAIYWSTDFISMSICTSMYNMFGVAISVMQTENYITRIIETTDVLYHDVGKIPWRLCLDHKTEKCTLMRERMLLRHVTPPAIMLRGNWREIIESAREIMAMFAVGAPLAAPYDPRHEKNVHMFPRDRV